MLNEAWLNKHPDPEKDPRFLVFWVGAERALQNEREGPDMQGSTAEHAVTYRAAVKAWMYANPVEEPKV